MFGKGFFDLNKPNTMCFIVLFSSISTVYIPTSASQFNSTIDSYSRALDENYFDLALNDVGKFVKTYSITSLNAYIMTDGVDQNPDKTTIAAAALK
jgi:hypothetical protein